MSAGAKGEAPGAPPPAGKSSEKKRPSQLDMFDRTASCGPQSARNQIRSLAGTPSACFSPSPKPSEGAEWTLPKFYFDQNSSPVSTLEEFRTLTSNVANGQYIMGGDEEGNKHMGTSDLFIKRSKWQANKENAFDGAPLRNLKDVEIFTLKQNNNRCSDWSRIRVKENFNALRLQSVVLEGDCALGVFDDTVNIGCGEFKVECGIDSCRLFNCQVGDNAYLCNVRFAANIIFEGGCFVDDVGRISCDPGAMFGCGQLISMGCETGGRELPAFAEITVDEAALIVRERGEKEGLELLANGIEEYCQQVQSDVGWVCSGATIRSAQEIRNTFLGAGAHIQSVTLVKDSCVLSLVDEPTTISEGSLVEGCILQWGVLISGGGIAKKSIFLEHSSVTDHGAVEESLLAPNTSVAKGEVTASLLGPFVGFHHQSLLISAFWPEGKGNVAYGAMLGSNHTGRAPDQEIRPGEGNFFGLGCSIRFPTDFSCAPYSLVAAGVRTLPQRVEFPFSLISTPEVAFSTSDASKLPPAAFNEIRPGWALISSAYALARAEMKFHSRNLARRHQFEFKVFRPATMALVRQALMLLKKVEDLKDFPKEYYTAEEVPGLGKNFLRETRRKEAIEAYEQALIRFALRIALGYKEDRITIPGSKDTAHSILKCYMPNASWEDQMARLIDIETRNAEQVLKSKQADDKRGPNIILGYEHAHSPAEKDKVVIASWERVEKTKQRISAALAKKDELLPLGDAAAISPCTTADLLIPSPAHSLHSPPFVPG